MCLLFVEINARVMSQDDEASVHMTRLINDNIGARKHLAKGLDNTVHIIVHKDPKRAAKVKKLSNIARRELLARVDQVGDEVWLPYGIKLGALRPEKCKVLSSAALPLWLAFEQSDAPCPGDFFETLEASRREAAITFGRRPHVRFVYSKHPCADPTHPFIHFAPSQCAIIKSENIVNTMHA